MKLNYVHTLSAVSFLVLSITAAPASAGTIGFEDISSPGCCTFLPDPYHGFTWSGSNGNQSWVVAAESDTPNFGGVEAHSGQNYAWSNGLSNLSIADGLFDFNSMWARGGSAGFTATAHGFVGGLEVYTQTFTVSTVHQLYVFNFLAVDKITLTGFSTNLLIDDITVNESASAVPEPVSSLAFLALGLAGLGCARRIAF